MLFQLTVKRIKKLFRRAIFRRYSNFIKKIPGGFDYCPFPVRIGVCPRFGIPMKWSGAWIAPCAAKSYLMRQNLILIILRFQNM